LPDCCACAGTPATSNATRHAMPQRITSPP
jgi:hypothetical protein